VLAVFGCVSSIAADSHKTGWNDGELMPVITEIADAVVTELNANTFSLQFTAQRHYQPRYELADLKTLHVTVIPNGLTTGNLGRGGMQREVAIDIAVQQKLSTETNADLDRFLALAEEIAESFQAKRLANFPNAIWVKTEHRAIYATEHLQQYRQFTSVMTLTFRVME